MLSALFSKWKKSLSDYINTQLQLLQLEIVERVATILGFVVYLIVFSFLLFISLTLLGIGLSECLSIAFESKLLGYSLVAFLYIIVLIVFAAMRQRFLNFISGIFIEILTKQQKDAA